MPRITGSRVAGAYGPRLHLDWTILEQDVSGNRSKVQVNVSMDVDGPISYTTKGNVRIEIGSSVANRAPSTSSGSTARSRYLAQHTAWVPHNSDGTKSVYLRAEWSGIGLNWAGTYVNSVSAGGYASLTKIARTTTINSASVKYTLQTDANNNPIANEITLSLNIGSSSFSHRIWLEYNGVFVGEWLNQSNPTSLALNTTHVGRMLGHLSNATSGTFRLYVGTDSGGTRIGNSAINLTASVNSGVVPKFTSNLVAISGSGKDKTLGIYVQSISRAWVSLSGEAGHGATVTKTSVRIGSSLIVSGTSGSITGNSSIISSSGTVSLEYSITDSRGRTTKETKSINVQPYSNPAIREFSVVRSSDPTKATLKYIVEHSTLGGKNSLTVNPRQDGTIVGGTSYGGTDARVSNTLSIAITGLNKFSTYEFTIGIQDGMGNRADSNITLTSSSLPLSLDKNNAGIGVGKDYERGALDVGGDAYISGVLYPEGGIEPVRINGNDNLNNYQTPGYYFNSVNTQVATIANTPSNYAFSLHVLKNAGVTQVFYEYRTGYYNVYIRNYYNGTWDSWRSLAISESVLPTSGSNTNGEWVRFPDGTQICWGTNTAIYADAWRTHLYQNYPVAFKDIPSVTATVSNGGGTGLIATVDSGQITTARARIMITTKEREDENFTSTTTHNYMWQAIGRWK